MDEFVNVHKVHPNLCYLAAFLFFIVVLLIISNGLLWIFLPRSRQILGHTKFGLKLYFVYAHLGNTIFSSFRRRGSLDENEDIESINLFNDTSQTENNEEEKTKNIIPFNILYEDPSGSLIEIFRKDEVIPAKKTILIPRPGKEIKIYEGKTNNVSENQLLGIVEINDLKPNIEVSFQIDCDHNIRVEIEGIIQEIDIITNENCVEDHDLIRMEKIKTLGLNLCEEYMRSHKYDFEEFFSLQDILKRRHDTLAEFYKELCLYPINSIIGKDFVDIVDQILNDPRLNQVRIQHN